MVYEIGKVGVHERYPRPPLLRFPISVVLPMSPEKHERSVSGLWIGLSVCGGGLAARSFMADLG
jgi:hypothetical protein